MADLAEGSHNLEALRTRPGASPGLISLETDLLAFRRRLISRIGESYPATAPEKAESQGWLRAGTALARRIDPLPPDGLLREAAAELLATLAPHLPGTAPLAQLADSEAGAWFTASWRQDPAGLRALAERAGVGDDVVLWTGRQLCSPFFHLLAAPVRGDAALAEARAPIAGCPCCGGPPRMGRYLGEEGRRWLWCDLCDLEWRFARVTCPFCLNRDHHSLGYLTVAGLDGYRVDVCKACGGFLRALDHRALDADASVDYLAEDIGTADLAAAAVRDGYRPGIVEAENPPEGTPPSSAGGRNGET